MIIYFDVSQSIAGLVRDGDVDVNVFVSKAVARDNLMFHLQLHSLRQGPDVGKKEKGSKGQNQNRKLPVP